MTSGTTDICLCSPGPHRLGPVTPGFCNFSCRAVRKSVCNNVHYFIKETTVWVPAPQCLHGWKEDGQALYWAAAMCLAPWFTCTAMISKIILIFLMWKLRLTEPVWLAPSQAAGKWHREGEYKRRDRWARPWRPSSQCLLLQRQLARYVPVPAGYGDRDRGMVVRPRAPGRLLALEPGHNRATRCQEKGKNSWHWNWVTRWEADLQKDWRDAEWAKLVRELAWGRRGQMAPSVGPLLWL